jgi:EpsI family protein
MHSNRTAFVIAVLMFGASIGAVVARPEATIADMQPAMSLEAIVPKAFGDWREEPERIVQVVNPQLQKTIETDYSEVLTRSYVNAEGYRVMLSLAYGSVQRGTLKLHKPEVCYSGQGFTLHRTRASRLATPYGEITVRRMFTRKGLREEPVTYWLRVGDKTVQAWQGKLVEVGYAVTGRAPDGLIFRISSIDSNQDRANQLHDRFIHELLGSVSPSERKYLSGLANM